MARLQTISSFKERLTGGGARPNLFEVEIPSFPVAAQDSWRPTAFGEAGTFTFLCKAATLPESRINTIPVPFRGRILKVAGDREISPWSVTIINDESFELRTPFEQWMNQINKLDNATGATNPSSYMTDAYVHQLGRGGVTSSQRNFQAQAGEDIPSLRTYKFYDIFPNNVSEGLSNNEQHWTHLVSLSIYKYGKHLKIWKILTLL